MKIKYTGHSLIEVIVVLLLIAISLSAIVSTNLTANKLTVNVLVLSEVISVTDSIASTMRNNSSELVDSKSRYLAVLTPHYQSSFACKASKRCQYQQQAIEDLKSWKKQFDNLFADYIVVICRDLTPSDGQYNSSDGCDNLQKSPIAIKVWWLKKGSQRQYQNYHRNVSL